MVGRFIVFLALFAFMVAPALAEEELQVEPDRTTMHENESLTLTVVGNMTLAINLDNLFNLGNLELPAPDIEKLEQDFEVLSQNQKYNVRTVNGDTQAEITWTYQLVPLKTGKLTIPVLTFNDAHSKPVTISVQPGPAPDTDGKPRDAFVELSTDKDSVYVQEQLVLTVRLFFSGNLIRGDLSEPVHPDAVVESLGKQQEYNRFRDGQRYRVVERRYAIYPQNPGELVLDPIHFDGQSRNSNGQLIFLRDSAQLFEVPVKAQPDQFSGAVWLPASELTLTENGLSGLSEVTVGQSMTQTVEVTAEGLPAAALPPLELDASNGLRSYPEQPVTSTDIRDDTLIGRLTQTTALVGVSPGQITLPEIRIPWWDTREDRERVAVIPQRTLTITPAAGAQAPPVPIEPPEQPAQDVDVTPVVQNPEVQTPGLWPWATGFLALGWVITLLLWQRQQRRRRPPTARANRNEEEKDLFDALSVAAGRGHPDTLDLLPRWMSSRHPGHTFTSASDVLKQADDPALKTELTRLQARLFGAGPASSTEEWDGHILKERLRHLRDKDTRHRATDELPPLYPEGLNPGSH